uniref:Putative ixodes 8-cys protein n=1 Tax=Ixodes ricinus TaxID=34613 RepID=A0A0K8RBT2_IXORI
MKVVCIILLFVIAADAASINEKTAVKSSTGNKNNYKIKFNYPPYIRNHHDFASKLLNICTDYKPQTREANVKQTTSRINDLKVDFQKCTFLCKREFGNVTLDLPEETPCGPNNQTCKIKEECVPYTPGC